MDKKAIEAKIMEIKQWEKEIKALTELVDSMKDEIKMCMTAEGIDELETATFIVRYKDVTTNRFDSKAFKKDNHVLYEAYTKPSTSKRFTID